MLLGCETIRSNILFITATLQVHVRSDIMQLQ